MGRKDELKIGKIRPRTYISIFLIRLNEHSDGKWIDYLNIYIAAVGSLQNNRKMIGSLEMANCYLWIRLMKNKTTTINTVTKIMFFFYSSEKGYTIWNKLHWKLSCSGRKPDSKPPSVAYECTNFMTGIQMLVGLDKYVSDEPPVSVRFQFSFFSLIVSQFVSPFTRFQFLFIFKDVFCSKKREKKTKFI